jgi:hypothetical protein
LPVRGNRPPSELVDYDPERFELVFSGLLPWIQKFRYKNNRLILKIDP